MTSWESAYLGASAVLGEPLDAAMASLSGEGAARCADLEQRLRDPSREVRARAIAHEVSVVALAVDAMSLA